MPQNKPPTPSVDAILRILQYEGQEKNAEKIMSEIDLGSKILSSIDFEKYAPETIINTITSMLGFLIMKFAKSDETRTRVIMKVCNNLLNKSFISPEDIQEKFDQLLSAGVIKSNKPESEQ